MFLVAFLSVVLSLVLFLARVLAGPTLFDRILAANSMGTGMVMFWAILGFLTGRPDFLDVGLTFALLNMIGTFAVLKFWRYGDLGDSGQEPE